MSTFLSFVTTQLPLGGDSTSDMVHGLLLRDVPASACLARRLSAATSLAPLFLHWSDLEHGKILAAAVGEVMRVLASIGRDGSILGCECMHGRRVEVGVFGRGWEGGGTSQQHQTGKRTRDGHSVAQSRLTLFLIGLLRRDIAAFLLNAKAF